MAVYGGLFVSLSVKKVPPSFWEALSALMPLVPILAMIFVVEKMLASRRVGTKGARP
jgi:hypothetical protein